MWWSEYTLYRLALDKHGLFDELHAAPAAPILCNAVWFQNQLPWDLPAALRNSTCIFSLVQSTADLPPSAVAAIVSAHIAS